jgi:hypothetical protein
MTTKDADNGNKWQRGETEARTRPGWELNYLKVKRAAFGFYLRAPMRGGVTPLSSMSASTTSTFTLGRKSMVYSLPR